MPYANNRGIRIHYEVEGDGEAVVLVHGFTSDMESWRTSGYTDFLNKRYRLVLVDARGHGLTDKPHDPAAYDFRVRVADVLVVLDELRIERAHYFGYSMGGRIGFACAAYAPQRFHTFVIGGQDPYSGKAEAEQFALLLRNGMQAFVASLVERFGPLRPQTEATLLRNDAKALLAAELAIIEHPGFAGTLPAMTMPCLVYCGEKDPFCEPAREAAQYMPNATFVSLPGLGHLAAFGRSNLVLPSVVEFLEKHSRRAERR